MRFLWFIRCIFLFIIIGCKNENQHDLLIKNSFSTRYSIQYKVDNVSIPIDSLSIFYYQKHSVINSGSSWILYGYNKITHAIDVLNITERKLLRHINLESQGPDGIIYVYGINVYNPDLIYILDRLALKCLNKYGRVTKKYSLRFTGLPGNVDGYFIQFNEARFEISDNGKYFTGYFTDSKIGGITPKEFLKHPIIGTIDLTSHDVKFLPIYYSDFIINNEADFSGEISPNITYLKDKIIYGFPVESNFYVFYRATGDVKAFGGASKYCSNLAKRYSSDKITISGMRGHGSIV